MWTSQDTILSVLVSATHDCPAMHRLLPFLSLLLPTADADITVPASTCYLNPDAGGGRVSRDGVSHWRDSATQISWYGKLNNTGPVNLQLEIKPPSETSELTLTVNQVGHATKALYSAAETAKANQVDFGTFNVESAGYYEFRLQLSDEIGFANGEIKSLKLTGAGSKDAHFNLKPRRNAASVHLAYPIERGTEVAAFYCEMTGLEDPLWSYYMACGWHRGYFGMQVNSPTERRIIFSVWDSGGEAIDRNKVADENRVQLVDKGDGVYSGDFGNEGTGGHSHLKFWWKTGVPQKFLVTAKPVSETHTIYSGYYFHPDSRKWMLISAWKAPKEGGYMRGLYSFSENFVGRNGHLVRKALYGNQWIRTAGGEWKELTTAKFSHDGTGVGRILVDTLPDANDSIVGGGLRVDMQINPLPDVFPSMQDASVEVACVELRIFYYFDFDLAENDTLVVTHRFFGDGSRDATIRGGEEVLQGRPYAWSGFQRNWRW